MPFRTNADMLNDLLNDMYGPGMYPPFKSSFEKDTRMIDARRDDGCVPVITTMGNDPTYV